MEALIPKERDARTRVLQLVAEQGEADADAIARWGQARQELAVRVSQMPVEDAQSLLAKELGEVDADLLRLEESGRFSRDEAFRRGVELGERLRWALWLADILSEELSEDPLVLVEEEVERIRTQSTELARLDARLEEVASRLSDRCEEVHRSLLRVRVQRFTSARVAQERDGSLEAATLHWLAAGEALQIETDCMSRPGLPCASVDGDGALGLDGLRRRRQEHIDGCAALLASAAPEEAEAFFRSSIPDLLDRASSLLSEGDASPPEVRLRILALLREQIDSHFLLLGPWEDRLTRRGGLGGEADRRRCRQEIRQLRKARRQILAAQCEARVQGRLEEIFGSRRLRLFENIILVLIFALLGLVFFEWRLMADAERIARMYGGGIASEIFAEMAAAEAIRGFNYADLLFCTVFQIDFFARWALAGWGLAYFLRHFFFESLPAFPYGFIFQYMGVMEEARAVILVRVVRLRRIVTLRALILVVLRTFRFVAFFVRGLDRAVEKFRSLVDRDVMIFDPDPGADTPESPLRRRALGMEARRRRLLKNLHRDAPWEERGRLLGLHAALLRAESEMAAHLSLPYRRGVREVRGEIHIERVIHGLLDCDVARILSLAGREGVDRLARWLRFLDFPVFRGAPIVRRLIPAARRLNPAEAVSAAANAVGQILQEALGMVRFWADLSGITTGPQVLDRVGSAVVRASRRPAMRLILFGGLFLLVEVLATPFPWLERVAQRLFRFLGLPLLVLGSICLVFLTIGRWFKRISGEALDLYLRTADAQFYPLLKAQKFRRHRDDLQLLYRSVLRPEQALRGSTAIGEEEWIDHLAQILREGARFLPGTLQLSDGRFAAFEDDRELVVLLYRDFLDSPVLHRSDDKASVQLLGNLSLQSLRFHTMHLTLRQLRKLERLDLDKGSLLALGPYFWFRFITESLAIETAKLIMEYNTTCIPRDQLHLASPRARERFERFLAEHGEVADSPMLRRPGRGEERFDAALSLASFTAFDFLGPTPEGDEAVLRRYGPEVLDALRRDRRAVVRDIFGTRPYHLLPRQQRVLNPYRLYRKYLGGAKFFLLPFAAIFGLLRLLFAGVSQVVSLVDEVLGRRKIRRSQLSRVAGFDVAIRKINRMRKPLFMEALRLRALVDVEYLGLKLPGEPKDEEAVTFRDDLDFIGALERERRPIEQQQNRVFRDLLRFQEFLVQHGWQGPGLDDLLARLDSTGELRRHRGEVLRALVTAYITDHESLRSVLTAPAWSRSFVEKALRKKPATLLEKLRSFVYCDVLRFLPENRRRRRMFEEFAERSAALEGMGRAARRQVRRRFLLADRFDERMMEAALRNLRSGSRGGDDAIVEALQRAACDYRLWTRKLITVRTIQALTLLDVKAYRDMVWRVGEYGSSGGRGG
ncbi:MAG: hypothetical protein JXA90_03820 [Planctomycetes bacterium]|nr:hypothetical protein [Planctomycetota bacterium]